MADNDHEQASVKPSEQRGGRTPDEDEARDKGSSAAASGEGVVPAELGGSDAPATESDVDLGGGDHADATGDGGPASPHGVGPDLKDAPNAARGGPDHTSR